MLAFIDMPQVTGVIFLIGIVIAIVAIWFMWRALGRAGLPGVIALIAIIPLGFLIVLGILAFAEWPNLATNERQNSGD